MSIKNVIILGAGGNLGSTVLEAFLEESSFKVSVISRKESKTTFPVTVNVIKADYSSAESLTDAFKGQDAVISLIASASVGDQNKLVDAAIAAGVKRFFPSEFGSDVPNKRAREVVPIFEGKHATVEYLKSKESEISWTSVVNGPFFDWGLKTGFLGFKAGTKTATIWDSGNNKFSSTTLHTIALTLIKSLEQADLTKNQYVYVSSFTPTQNEILAAAEKASGEKWTVNHIDTTKHIEEGNQKIAKHDYSGVLNLLQGITTSDTLNLGDFSYAGLWNEKLGLPKENFEEEVKKALVG